MPTQPQYSALKWRFFFYSFLVLFVGCQARPAPTLDLQREIKQLKAYQVQAINLDYIARCKIQIKSSTVNQSGSCSIIITAQNQMRFTAYHPLGGELLINYMDPIKIQIMDRDQKIFYDLRNNRENRKRIPEMMDLEVSEFLEILWGREISNISNELQFVYEGLQPKEVTKKTMGSHLKVRYKKWKLYQGVLFPKIILLEDLKQKTSIKLVITEFTPGKAEEVGFSEIPEGYSVRY
ncbi:MAG: hypothetical protein COB67_05010 [SAR324 cluster bacterium]|uniref:DUF4292 domain-containing protein n=1 Tax=SAR324 cluster bacterium TaxID=2024889 RepID=A0A2A4T670_9DELT|nr:MAG: hypothetical protein COB67_05010 [SAR324 cluster bacterium]